MRKTNPKSCNIDSFKYSILISYTNKYNFTDTNPLEFEKK